VLCTIGLCECKTRRATVQSAAGPGANTSDLVSPAIFVSQHPSSVAAILKPFAVVPPPVRPNHKTTPCHHIIHPFALVPAHPPHLESSAAAASAEGRRTINCARKRGCAHLLPSPQVLT
jgi:hypothetical protein